jgi:DNA-binding transcriptional regulator WhiA
MARKQKPWNRGFTKETHPGVLKISGTFKRKGLDNFKEWRYKMKKLGKIRSRYPAFRKTGDLAELIGLVLGDGHIESFPRTESLTIACNAKNAGLVRRCKDLLRKLFEKEPYEGNTVSNRNCIRVRVYQKNISRRLGLPTGDRKDIRFRTPIWISGNKEYLKRYLRGLYEAEGSLCTHKPTCTYKLFFSNRNKFLRENVYRGLKILGFHPHRGKYQIQVSRKKEVYEIKDLIRFRQY